MRKRRDRSFQAFIADLGGASGADREIGLPPAVTEEVIAIEESGATIPPWTLYLMAGYRSRRKPKADLAVVQAAFDAGATRSQVKAKFGLSEHTLQHYRKTGALVWIDKRMSVDYAAAAEKLAGGLTVSQAAAALGVSRNSIYAGIEDGLIPRGAVWRRHGAAGAVFDGAQIVAMHDDGLSVVEIAKRTGASRATVRRYINERASSGRRIKPRRKKKPRQAEA